MKKKIKHAPREYYIYNMTIADRILVCGGIPQRTNHTLYI